jgi:hypothetical protein
MEKPDRVIYPKNNLRTIKENQTDILKLEYCAVRNKFIPSDIILKEWTGDKIEHRLIKISNFSVIYEEVNFISSIRY